MPRAVPLSPDLQVDPTTDTAAAEPAYDPNEVETVKVTIDRRERGVRITRAPSAPSPKTI